MRRVRMAMVGGGGGAFIGPVHRMAAELDGGIALVAGAFSSDPGRSREAAERYGLAPERGYADWRSMMDGERARPDGAELIAIVTPNHLHLSVAKAALQAGFAVMSDKPMTATYAEARELAALARDAGAPYRLSYTYTGYPLVREARRLVAEGRLGRIRKVVVEYSQGWLARRIEDDGLRQAAWRTDPAQAGAGGCIGDIGVHAFNLAEFVTGLRVTRVLADLNIHVDGRRLDDDCNVLLRFQNGATGALVASQIAVGDRNRLHLRVYGEDAALEWAQEQPNVLTLRSVEGSELVFHAGGGGLGGDAMAATRLPTGHPEGYLEAFANLYRDFASLLRGEGDAALVPDAGEGLRGMAFIERSLQSSQAGGWTDLETQT